MTNIPAHTFFYQLLENPLVCVISSGLLMPSGIDHAVSLAAGRRCLIIVQPAWQVGRDVCEFIEVTSEIQRHHPYLSFLFICPSIKETELLLQAGLRASHVHKNAFIDDSVFRIMDISCKRYPAIHIANIEKFKRHYLAWGIEDIAVITYNFRIEEDLTELSGYKKLGFANFEYSTKIKNLKPELTPHEVAKIINISNCGLILSESEGANNASTEYLLCGVPVVSTLSIGGRDEFFTSNNSLIVDPNPDAVERAVNFFNSSKVDPHAIRDEVMIKIRKHRKLFLELLSAYSNQNLFLEATENYWHHIFKNKLRTIVPNIGTNNCVNFLNKS